MLYSLLLHTVAAVLLVLSLDDTPARTMRPVATAQIVQAVTVDGKQIEKELQRLQAIEDDKLKQRQVLERKLNDLEQKKAQAEEQRRLEEKKLAQARQKKIQEQARREEEQKKLARLKKEQDELEQKKRKAEQARKIAEQKKREAEEERQRLEKEAAERKRKEEAEQKRRAQEQQRRAAELAEEQRQLEAEQARQDQSVIRQYAGRINNAIAQSFNTTGLPPGLSCVLQIRMVAGGEVVVARVVKSSGNEVFDRRAETAVNKASPLPVPDDPRQFEKLRELRLTFAPKNRE